MTFEFRATTPDDAPAVAALCTRILPVGPRSRVFAREQLQWKYWAPWPSWPGSRGYLLLEHGEPIAHAGIVPLPFARGGRAHTLVQLIDWAASPQHIGSGVVLLKRIAALADGAVSVRGSSMTQRILGPLGFRSLGEVVQYAAVARAPAHPPGSELARMATLRMHTRDDFAAREHPLHAAQSSDERIVIQRSAAQIRAWLACPGAPLRYGEVTLGERLIGAFLLCETPQQARIADAWADDALAGAWHALFELAYREGCRQPDATEVVFQGNDPDQQRALAACGFVVTGSDPLALLAGPALAPSSTLWRHQLIDSDLAYLHHGEPWPWLR